LGAVSWSTNRRVVLGVVTLENPDVSQDTPVESVMRPDPVTFRPHVPVDTLPEYVKTQRRRALVTTSDGVLIGLLRIDSAQGDVR
jgi:hypothetical protein